MRKTLVALLLLAPPIASAQHHHEPLFNVVSLAAQAEREVANDTLHAVLAAEAEGIDPAKLADEVNGSMKRALETARGYRSVTARSGSYQSFPVYDKNRVARWRVRQELRLESTDFSAATALIGKLQASLVVAHMSLGVSNQARKQAENALIGEAIAAFQERAGLARDALRAKGYRVKEIEVSGGGPMAPRPYAAPAGRVMMEAAAAPSVEPGTSRIVISVSGTVQLQE